MSQNELQRAEFERWLVRRWNCSTEKWADSGEYKYSDTRNWWECWKASIESAQAVATGGWKLVPVEATDEQIESGVRNAAWPGNPVDHSQAECRRIYRAMLAAAPASDPLRGSSTQFDLTEPKPASEPPNWQSNMTADDTTGKCCAFMGTERCSCGRYVASEAKGQTATCPDCWGNGMTTEDNINWRQCSTCGGRGKTAASSAAGPTYPREGHGGPSNMSDDFYDAEPAEQEQAGESDDAAIREAFEKESAAAFERADPEGGWQWRPSAYEAFKLGYTAALLRRAARVEVATMKIIDSPYGLASSFDRRFFELPVGSYSITTALELGK